MILTITRLTIYREGKNKGWTSHEKAIWSLDLNQQNLKGETQKRWLCPWSAGDSETRGSGPGDVMESNHGGISRKWQY